MGEGRRRSLSFEVVTHGLPELRAALNDIQGRVDPVLGKALSAAAVPVRDDARQRASGYSPRTVAGIRIRRKGTMVRVEQGQKKTTGFHPSYGPFQQKHFFDPALKDHQADVVKAAQEAMDELAAIVNEAP